MIRDHIPESIKEEYRRLRAAVLSVGLEKSKEFAQPPQELEASRSISVIVAIHDAPQVTYRCLNSLAHYGSEAEIILVNDGSQNMETLKIINDFQQKTHCCVINHDKALGHSQACQSGVSVSERKYLCLLNSDTVITPWSWNAAKEAFDCDSKIAVSGPSTSWAGTGQALPRAEYCRIYWNDSQIYDFAQKHLAKQPARSWIDLPEISGFALFIRRSIWDQFDGFDTKFPDYGNETELCRRILQNGLRIVWTKNSYIHHFGRASFGGVMTKDQIRNKRQAAKEFINNLQK